MASSASKYFLLGHPGLFPSFPAMRRWRRLAFIAARDLLSIRRSGRLLACLAWTTKLLICDRVQRLLQWMLRARRMYRMAAHVRFSMIISWGEMPAAICCLKDRFSCLVQCFLGIPHRLSFRALCPGQKYFDLLLPSARFSF